MPRTNLTDLNGRWWDWRIEGLDGWTLRLIADNDLTYHHAVEVLFRGVDLVCSPTEFSHPVFRAPTQAELERATRILNGDFDQAIVFSWDLDTTQPEPCMIVAEAVEVVEGLVPHAQPSP